MSVHRDSFFQNVCVTSRLFSEFAPFSGHGIPESLLMGVFARAILVQDELESALSRPERVRIRLSYLRERGIVISRPVAEMIVRSLLIVGETPQALSYMSLGGGVSEELQQEVWSRFHHECLYGNAPIGADNMSVLRGRPQLSLREKLRLPDMEFVREYYIQMSGYEDMDRRSCWACRAQIPVFYDLRRIAGLDFCPACFPAKAKNMVGLGRNLQLKNYYRRAAELLPIKSAVAEAS